MNTPESIRDRVLEIVRSSLMTDRATCDDNFFELGGDSLALVEICTTIEGEFDIELPLELVWEAATVGDMASVVGRCLLGEPTERDATMQQTSVD